MPARDMRGEEIPVGKIERRLDYDGVVETSSPDWLSQFGDGTERKDSVAEGRGELNLTVADGFGGFAGPAVDPDAFRELRLRVGIQPTLTDGATLLLGFADDPERRGEGGWCLFREYGGSNRLPSGELRTGQLWYGAAGEESTTGNLGKLTPGSALVEIRVRPFERGVTIQVGGAGRGDVLYEDDDCAYRFGSPIRPTIGLVSGDGDGPDRVAISTVSVALRHN